MNKAYLILEDGTVFEGTAFGAKKEVSAELVFNTNVVGYLETLTDPANEGRIILQTFPLIGNYGVIPADIKGNCTVAGYAVRELCDTPSNFRCEGTLDEWLRKQGIPGIAGLDTRALTRILREQGSVQAKIVYEVKDHAAE